MNVQRNVTDSTYSTIGQNKILFLFIRPIRTGLIDIPFSDRTPWFAKTRADGTVRIDDLPAGDYELRAWHYSQGAAPAMQPLTLLADDPVPAQFTVPLKVLTPRPGTK